MKVMEKEILPLRYLLTMSYVLQLRIFMSTIWLVKEALEEFTKGALKTWIIR
jgi:hypothetical protein